MEEGKLKKGEEKEEEREGEKQDKEEEEIKEREKEEDVEEQHPPIVVTTVPAKKKELQKSQLEGLEEFPAGLTPCCQASSITCSHTRTAVSNTLIQPQTHMRSSMLNIASSRSDVMVAAGSRCPTWTKVSTARTSKQV